MKLPLCIRFSLSITCVCVMFGLLACQRSIQDSKAEPLIDRNNAMSNAEDERIAHDVKKVILEYCQYRGEAKQAKEAIAAMAAVVGERCIEAAGEYSARNHEFVTGQRVFSDNVNTLLAGDIAVEHIAEVPANTVFGTIRDQLAGSRFQRDHFPGLSEVFQSFASRIGKPEDWGKIPLSVSQEHWPDKLALRVAFDTRPRINAALGALSEKKLRSLRICTLALTYMLKELGNNIDPKIALTLTLETVNGMAKTAPMTDKAIDNPSQEIREAQHQVIRIEPRSKTKLLGDPE
jgi:hypothetical protein